MTTSAEQIISTAENLRDARTASWLDVRNAMRTELSGRRSGRPNRPGLLPLSVGDRVRAGVAEFDYDFRVDWPEWIIFDAKHFADGLHTPRRGPAHLRCAL